MSLIIVIMFHSCLLSFVFNDKVVGQSNVGGGNIRISALSSTHCITPSFGYTTIDCHRDFSIGLTIVHSLCSLKFVNLNFFHIRVIRITFAGLKCIDESRMCPSLRGRDNGRL